MLTEQQIEAKVMAKYPRIPEERNCKQRRLEREALRGFYRERLRTNQEHPTLN